MKTNLPNEKNNKLKNVKRVYSFWGRFPSLYGAQDVITFLGRAKFIRKQAVQRLGLRKGDTVLEVACGSGRNFPYLVEAVGPKGKIIGFDYSQDMLNAAKRLCQQKGWKNIKLIQGDAAKLKILHKNIAGVISVLGISAVPNWERALERSYALLRPGGSLVVCDARLFTRFLRFFNPLVRGIYSRFAAWDPSKDIPGKMKNTFRNVKVENFNLGTFFIAVAVKRGK
ncbi:MAG: methyltransferase domain-containing protein [Nanoarchaeota archaeon]